MAISEWSEQILVADLQDEPLLSDDLSSLMERIDATEQSHDIVLNFQSVEFVNSSNISQLLRLRQVCEGKGGSICLCSVNNRIWSVLLVTNLDRLFHFEGDMASALASLQMNSANPDA